jgi:hypothetical protein
MKPPEPSRLSPRRKNIVNISYEDILSRIDQEPVWWLGGVPRFDPFKPSDLDIYAQESALISIRCQACRTPFKVGVFSRSGSATMICDMIAEGSLPIGDPPNIGCCDAGPTMSSDQVRVEEYWKRDRFDWTRDAAMERLLCDHEDYRNTPDQG